jgi:predicted outer membrane repeat protein
MGAASAADDVSMDAVDASVDDAITVDAAIDDTEDSTAVEETPVDTISDDTTTEEINEEIQTDEISEESVDVDSEPTRATDADAEDWDDLKYYGSLTTNYNIHLTSPITVDNTVLEFKNSATIIGTPNNYITGGNSGKIPFQSTGNLDITFINVTFKDMSASVLMKLATSGHNRIINCTFDNIHTYAFQSSVIWNNGGWMTITGSNFTNCNNSYGAITNHKTYDTVFMSVENCRFENNTGRYEPGAINNCGVLNVTDSTFINNKAGQWAGAIHTHSNAYSRIVDSNFTNNVAGTNGGAIFSYSKLEVINSTFTGNTATNNGGAICGYSYGSIYNVTVENSRFINNKVNSGAGGAIRAMNLGYLNVCYSNFTNNSASNGQAISGITETIDYCNCWNCTCPNCPNCENCTHYISNESANLKICHNIFLNHTGSSDTVTISGNDYIFDYNVFINSTQNTHYNGTGNQYGLTTYPNPMIGQSLLKSSLTSSVLGDKVYHDIIFVNVSSSNNPKAADITGENWDLAFGTERGFSLALNYINNNGIIYLADGIYTNSATGSINNITIIGMSRDQTIFDINEFTANGEEPYADNVHSVTTYINMTFKNPSMVLRNGQTFINCTFISPIIKTNEDIYNTWTDSHNADGITDSFAITFTDCEFKDYNIEGSLLEAFRFSQINFNNCTFKDITANSIVNNTGGFTLQDAINFYDCTFDNVAVKGIVDVPTGTAPVERYRIEGCTGIGNFGPITEGDRDYVNTTQSRTETVLIADIDADGNLFINLTDVSGNAMAEEEVLISINGAEATPYALGADGTLSIALADLTDATGKLDIAVTYEENDDYKGSTGSVSTVLVINNVTVEVPVEVPVYITVNQTATSITASDITATAKVAKTLSVTLKDANGKVLANKAVKVTVNGKTSTVTTDKNGVAKVNVNYAKAGTYYYTLSFLGDNDYKASMKAVKVTVNKQATKATFAKKTFKVKATKKLTFTLKDAKGKAIKGKKITFTVNKKTYTAKTNAKGIATVKVKLTKKGKYTAVAKFAGDTTYKAISKKATITIK